ncbi:hypothetical protein D3C78_1862160 [compost metagenome]
MFSDLTIAMTFIVQYLHFQAGSISVGIFGLVFINVENDPAIGFRGYFPIYFKVEIAVFFIGYQVSSAFSS